MSNAYALVPTSSKVALDAARNGRASFNVTNTSGRALLTRVEVRPAADAEPAWFSVDGDAERHLGPNATDKFTVSIAVPPTVAEGKQHFRLLAYAVERPSELFTEGSAIEVEVPEAPVAPPKPKPFPWWIVAVAAVVILVLVGGSYWWANRGPDVPEVANTGTYGQVRLSNFTLGDAGNVARVAPGAAVSGQTEYVYDCPNCQSGSINQIILGIAGQDRAQACIYNGRTRGSGNSNFQLTAPREPGVHLVRFRYAQDVNCDRALGWWTVDGAPDERADIGVIVVE